MWQQVQWNAKCQHQNCDVDPFPFLSKGNIAIVEFIPFYDSTTATIVLFLLAAVQTVAINYCRYKKQGYKQGNTEIDNNNGCKIIQRSLYIVGHKKDNH